MLLNRTKSLWDIMDTFDMFVKPTYYSFKDNKFSIPLPGVASEDVEIEADESYVYVNVKKENLWKIYVPTHDTGSVFAEMKNGLLTIELQPKKKVKIQLNK